MRWIAVGETTVGAGDPPVALTTFNPVARECYNVFCGLNPDVAGSSAAIGLCPTQAAAGLYVWIEHADTGVSTLWAENTGPDDEILIWKLIEI